MTPTKYINKITSELGFIKGLTGSRLINNLHRANIIIKIKELQELIEKTSNVDMLI
jgi:ribosomal protein L20